MLDSQDGIYSWPLRRLKASEDKGYTLCELGWTSAISLTSFQDL